MQNTLNVLEKKITLAGYYIYDGNITRYGMVTPFNLNR